MRRKSSAKKIHPWSLSKKKLLQILRFFFPKQQILPPFKSVDYIRYWEKSSVEREIQFSVGGTTAVLFDKNVPVHRRINALGTTAEMHHGAKNRILRELLPEQLDEIRLLAFQLLEGQEKKLSREIDFVTRLLKKFKKPAQQAYGNKLLAQLYYEFLYQDLLQAELRTVIIDKSLQYALSAVEELKSDPALWALIGKLYHAKKSYTLAEPAFSKAIYWHALPSHTQPFLAEAAFLKKDFNSVKNIFSHTPSLFDLYKVGRVAAFWLNPR